MARPPLTPLAKRVAGPRDLARRSFGLVKGSLGYLQAFRAGKVPGPLLLAIRAANELAEQVLQQPTPSPTPAQRRVLRACATQIRALGSGILISSDGRDPHSLESELRELITRTLALIERVTADESLIIVHERPTRSELSSTESPAELPRADPERETS